MTDELYYNKRELKKEINRIVIGEGVRYSLNLKRKTMKKIGHIITSFSLATLILGTSVQAQTENHLSRQAKGAIIGTGVGAAAGAAMNKNNRVLGGVAGGVIGGATGYAVGKQPKKKWNPQATGVAIGAGTGAAAGAVLYKKNRALGGVVGGIAGGAAGYAIGKKVDKKRKAKEAERVAAANWEKAERAENREYRTAGRSSTATRTSTPSSTRRNSGIAAAAAPVAAGAAAASLAANNQGVGVYAPESQADYIIGMGYLPNPFLGDPSAPYSTLEVRRKSW